MASNIALTTTADVRDSLAFNVQVVDDDSGHFLMIFTSGDMQGDIDLRFDSAADRDAALRALAEASTAMVGARRLG